MRLPSILGISKRRKHSDKCNSSWRNGGWGTFIRWSCTSRRHSNYRQGSSVSRRLLHTFWGCRGWVPWLWDYGFTIIVIRCALKVKISAFDPSMNFLDHIFFIILSLSFMLSLIHDHLDNWKSMYFFLCFFLSFSIDKKTY